jgi:hypothetical protein
MIICQSCRAENWDGAQFCDECNKPLPRLPRAQGGVVPPQGFFSADAPAAQPAPRPHGPQTLGGDQNGGGENGRPVPVQFPQPAPVAPSPRSAAAPAPETAAGPLAAHARLTINRGRSAGKEFLVHEDEAYIGRWDADSGIFPDIDLDADDPEAKVSRRHARVTRRGQQYYIEDLGSTNGTFVNRGRRLLPGDRQPLNDGDEIIIGKTFLKFEVVK